MEEETMMIARQK
jgi:hypothetical protein